MMIKSTAIVLLTGCVLVAAQSNNQAGRSDQVINLSNLPGAKTASGIMASTTNGMSRYFADNGPLQPAITAISGMPMRAGETANRGLSAISSGFRNGAQRFANSANQDPNNIRMPGRDRLAEFVPPVLNRMGGSMQNMIQSKNNFIRGQAQRGIDAANRMGQAIRS